MSGRKGLRCGVVPRSKNNDFIERGGEIVGHWAYGRARLLYSRVPVLYWSEPLRTCGVCGRVGWDSVQKRSAESRFGYPEFYDCLCQPLCVKCYFYLARKALVQERIWGEEDNEIDAMSELVRQYRIVINKPPCERVSFAKRFDERIRPTSIDLSKVVNGAK